MSAKEKSRCIAAFLMYISVTALENRGCYFCLSVFMFGIQRNVASNFLQRFQRETEVQRQMFAVLFGAGCEGSLHFFGEGAGDGESEAGAALVARIVWRVETLEEPRHVIQR